MNLRLASLTLLASVVFSACVTVNVNFPEGAVQKATDDYVQNLYRAREKGKSPASIASPEPTPPVHGALLDHCWSWISSAQADDSGFRVDTPKSLDIRERLRARVADVIQQKRAGVLGEDNAGLLVLKDSSTLKPLLKTKIQKLVVDENSDRTSLYEEIIRANGFTHSKLPQVARSFGRSFQAESPSRTWVQDSDGKWSQKP